jgi:serine protease Do
MEEKNVPLKNSVDLATPAKKRKTKVKLALFIISLLMVAGCFVSLLFLWYGGYIKDIVCKSVRDGSVIWNKFSCSVAITGTTDEIKFPMESLNQNVSNYSSEDNMIQSIVESSSNAVVGIGLLGDNVNSLDQIIGTGFIVSKAGLIVTNRHVVEAENENYYVVFKDNNTPVNIEQINIFRDPVNDIALIKIDKEEVPSNMAALPLGDSDILKLGQTVIAIGNPLGKYSGTITKGIVSGLNREVSITKGFFSSQSEVYSDVIQTDAAINPGNSGGPLINNKGEVVGINFATIEGASNLSFALPINRVKLRISELEKNGKFKIPYLGVEYRLRVVFLKGQSFIGAEITNVINGSPAEVAGIFKGDIILDFNGESLENNTLSTLIQKTTIGSKVEVVLYRNKLEKTIEVIIGER